VVRIRSKQSTIQWMIDVEEELQRYLKEIDHSLNGRAAFSRKDIDRIVNRFTTWPHTKIVPDVIELPGIPPSYNKFMFGCDYFSPGGNVAKMRYLYLIMDHLTVARKSFRSFQCYMPVYISHHAVTRLLERGINDYSFLAKEIRSIVKLGPAMLLYFNNRDPNLGQSRVFFLPSTVGGFVCRYRPGNPAKGLEGAIDIRTYLSIHELNRDQMEHRSELSRNLIPHDDVLKRLGIRNAMVAVQERKISGKRKPEMDEDELLDLIGEFMKSVPLEDRADRLDAVLWGVPEGSRACTGNTQPVP